MNPSPKQNLDLHVELEISPTEAATYLRNTKDELFTVRKLREQGEAQ